MPAMRSRAPDGAPAAARAAWRLPALLPGVVSGAALQLLQPRLWPPLVYGALLCAALALGWCAGATATRRRHAALWAAAPGLLGAGLGGGAGWGGGWGGGGLGGRRHVRSLRSASLGLYGAGPGARAGRAGH